MYFQMSWVVRTTSSGPALERQIRDALRSVDPRQPLSRITTMEAIRTAAVDDQRFLFTLLASFGVIGLLLATAGVYGLVSYSAAQRTREFGIRMALGAPRASILRRVLASGALLAVIGVILGAGASLASRQVLSGLVWGVSASDPATFTLVALVLVGVAVLASLIPALRAVKLNPVAALRE
jgi:putative ABC transport system permease protein